MATTDTKTDPAAWHTLSVEEAVRQLKTDPARGLSRVEVEKRSREYGPNTLVESKGRSALTILLEQFRSLIVILLLVAAGIAFAMGDVIEGVVILAVIVVNAAIGFFTEWKAEQTLAALAKQTVPSAHVIRDGAEVKIPAAELVPGDLVVLEAGSRVPADGRIVEAARLQVQEASLTGESHAVSKTTDAVPEANAPLGDRVSMAFLGTSVTDGRGVLLVIATGMKTEVGKIGTMIEEAQEGDTPLERKLAQLGHALVGVVLVLCAVIVVAGWLRGLELLTMLKVGISLAIAAVPEGLPAVSTMTLALGMQRMARMNALVRRLPAVETLGSTTVICTDKTGTLTKNEMTVRAYRLGERLIEVTGTGYTAKGEFREGNRALDAKADVLLAAALRAGALCSDVTLERKGDASVVLGDPTEAALVVAAEKAGMPSAELDKQYPRVGEVPFSSETKRMATVHRTPDGKTVAYVKGAPGPLVEASREELTPEGVRPLGPEDRKRVLKANEELAGQALRVLGLAYREVGEGYREEELFENLVFIGLVGMIDPLREEAKAAIETCREAGIRTIMITGDQEATAREIGRQLGLDRDLKGSPLKTVHGRELATLDATAWTEVAEGTGVFARVSPEHKLRIVEGLQTKGEVVAMTGDGVNDAPALKKADIGVAMGIKGTEVAKEASAMVILDDNFATIVSAVEQGRIIYANILRFIHYLFSCNLSEILVVFLAILIGWPLPLAALQVLWLNLITDVFPAMALALEPSTPDAMRRPPRDPREPLVNAPFMTLIAWQGLLLAAVTLVTFGIGLNWYSSSKEHAVTLAFMTLALCQVFHVFNARSQKRSAFDRLFTNAWLWGAVLLCVGLQVVAVYWEPMQRILSTVPLTASDWGLVAACSLAPIAVIEVVKFGTREPETPAGIQEKGPR